MPVRFFLPFLSLRFLLCTGYFYDQKTQADDDLLEIRDLLEEADDLDQNDQITLFKETSSTQLFKGRQRSPWWLCSFIGLHFKLATIKTIMNWTIFRKKIWIMRDFRQLWDTGYIVGGNDDYGCSWCQTLVDKNNLVCGVDKWTLEAYKLHHKNILLLITKYFIKTPSQMV